ncbi:nucleotidyltransferase domain-containing protein [Paenibacillus thermotolerans]|uniref:nucleotidyltransferase domain-containing protein n=1 Tax=Paenibacillus thermotolerans TaxID=3027807 RepID=UPI0023680635|nr:MULTISPECIES: nucleotidyltransferase domain-containing protein [unclassified Paenibacillus]
MNTFLEHTISELTAHLMGIKAIILRGSRLQEEQVDFWSDYDLLVVLEPEAALNEHYFIQAVERIGTVIGCESYRKPESFLYRTAIEHNESIHLLDASICTYNEWLTEESASNTSTVVYGQIHADEVKERQTDFSFDSYESKVSEVWFKYFVAIKKFARNDNLIGLHLLLELVREYLVVEMIERDIQQGTNIHRFGRQEKLPVSIKLTQIEESNKQAVFNYILNLAKEYDDKLIKNVKDYTSRFQEISDYVNETKRQFKKNVNIGDDI